MPLCVGGLLIALWLFLPPGAFNKQLGELRKTDLVRLLPLLCLLWLAPGRLRFKWSTLDALVLAACCCPLASALANGLGWQLATLEAIKELIYWFVPYALGRAICDSQPARRQLAWVLVIGGVCYLPLAAFEIFSGPVLNDWLTGSELLRQQRGADRGTSFRPSVFLSSGFVLTMFFALCALLAVQLGWESCAETKHTTAAWQAPRSGWKTYATCWIIAAILAAMVLACKSLGSIVLLAVGLIVLGLSHWTRSRLWLLGLLLIPPLYLTLRISDTLSTQHIASAAASVTSQTRADSLAYRLRAEDRVYEHMQGHWWWGFGHYGLWRQGAQVLSLDGFWLYVMTRNGLVSVLLWQSAIVLILSRSVFGAGACRRPSCAIDMRYVMALFLALALVDSLFNYFGEAPWMMLLGAVGQGCAVNKYPPRE